MKGHGPPYQSHSATSRAAAESMTTLAETRRADVYRFIHSRQKLGATDEEIQLALKMSGSTERPRRVELFDAGLVVDSGRKRLTSTRRNAVVWVTWHHEELFA